jgi:hypothetical protein
MTMPFRASPIEMVQNGMHVFDSNGRDCGEVEYVQMGDPEALTTRGNEASASGFVGGLAASVAGSEPDVPQPLKDRLLRTGFVKIDGPGLTDTDRYLMADRIAGVDGNRVLLACPWEKLAEED